MITKSGGNQFSGSFRANFANEAWEGETPLTTDQEDKINTVYEATFGGYIIRDALWFFAAARTSDGPPMSLFSMASGRVTSGRATVASNG